MTATFVEKNKIKHTFCELLHNISFLHVLFRTVLANHVLISSFELRLNASKMVTTETFGGVSVVISLVFFGW